jgi:transposase
MNPAERALVLCVDEKSRIQALDRTAPLLAMGPGQIERRTHDYARHGTTSLFAALDTKTGKIIGLNQQRHRSVEFGNFPRHHRDRNPQLHYFSPANVWANLRNEPCEICFDIFDCSSQE